MTLYETDLLNSAYGAKRPWNSIDAQSRIRHRTENQALIDKCCNCPYADCFDCVSHKAIPKYMRFVALFELSKPMDYICKELKISRSSYFNYKNKLMKGAIA